MCSGLGVLVYYISRCGVPEAVFFKALFISVMKGYTASSTEPQR